MRDPQKHRTFCSRTNPWTTWSPITWARNQLSCPTARWNNSPRRRTRAMRGHDVPARGIFLGDRTRTWAVAVPTSEVSERRPDFILVRQKILLGFVLLILGFCFNSQRETPRLLHWGITSSRSPASTAAMPAEMWMESPFPARAAPHGLPAGAYRQFLPQWFRALWSLLISFQICACPYLK